MRILLVLLLLSMSAPALAQTWDRYENARFGYGLSIPPGFEGGGESDNGDGQLFTSSDGTQTLRVFGGNVLEDFAGKITEAMDYARDDGWVLSYERVTPSWASFSGTRNGIIVYARAIALCGGTQFASFELRYPMRDLQPMNAVVERLVRSLEETGDGVG
jgi:hypothetical protein